jgi:ABC-type branched-subunit amino acid transport system ATPase component/ABC-type branched-subunit amino acid transport system permease subunit
MDWKQPIRRLHGSRLLAIVVVSLAVVVLELLLGRSYPGQLLLLVLLWAVAAQSWNLSYGYAGMLSFGHSAFVGIGAYTVALAYLGTGLSPFLGIPLAIGAAVLLAAVIGIPTFRLEGAYFALATIVFPLIAIIVIDSFGLNELSLPFPPEPRELWMDFSDRRLYVYLALFLFVAVMLFLRWVEGSRAGLLLRAIRENADVARALGVDIFRWKLFALTTGAAIAATMAVVWVKAVLLIVASADVFGLPVLVQMIAICLVGGVGTLWGPVIGAAILVPLAETVNLYAGAQIPGIQVLVYGITLVVVILVAPEGIYWRVREVWYRRRPSATDSTLGTTVQLRAPAPRTDRYVLEATDLWKSFGGVTAVAGASIRVSSREIVGLIGPNGAGKTTLFNLLAGHYKLDRGSILFGNVDIGTLHAHERARQGIARTFQTSIPLPRLTIAENVTVAALNRTRDINEAREVALAALEAVGLTRNPNDRVGVLSTLEVKLLEVARAIATGPELLLIDEPMAGVNPAEQVNLGDLFIRLRADGYTLVVIEHSVRSLIRIVDRLVVLDEGKVIADGDAEAVVQNERVIQAYLGAKWVRGAARRPAVS